MKMCQTCPVRLERGSNGNVASAPLTPGSSSNRQHEVACLEKIEKFTPWRWTVVPSGRGCPRSMQKIWGGESGAGCFGRLVLFRPFIQAGFQVLCRLGFFVNDVVQLAGIMSEVEERRLASPEIANQLVLNRSDG